MAYAQKLIFKLEIFKVRTCDINIFNAELLLIEINNDTKGFKWLSALRLMLKI